MACSLGGGAILSAPTLRFIQGVVIWTITRMGPMLSEDPETRACFPRIAPATCANDAPLETVANRSAPMACGPNVDQAGRPGPNGLRSDAPDRGSLVY
jgi:hypothetical protein